MKTALLLVLAAAAARAGEPFSVPACQRPRSGVYFLGVAGPAGDETDRFGRDNLVALSSGAERSALFAVAPSTSEARLGLFLNPIAAPAALESLAKRPEREARLVITGHGGPAGVFLGKGLDGGDRYLLHEPFFEAVRGARRAGIAVKAEFLSCFSGSFMPAMMPGEGLAPACGVASSLPEKRSEGCYQSADTSRADYAARAAETDGCGIDRDYRVVHQRVFDKLESYDIPMLSSDYFLLYGPGAEFLGRGARAPFPPRTLVRRDLGEEAAAYLDLVNARVVAVVGRGGRRPPPGVDVEDCLASYEGAEAPLDGTHHSSFFLRRALTETTWPAPDCIPRLGLDWGAASPRAGVLMAALPGDAAWEHGMPREERARFERELRADELEAPLGGLRPGARLLLSRLLPEFQEYESGRDLSDHLKKLAALYDKRDPARARSMRALIAGMWRKSGARDGVSQGGTRFEARWLETYLVELYNDNETSTDNLDYSRLAFLAAAAIAEESLRREAPGEPEAKKLLADFEALRACEKGLP